MMKLLLSLLCLLFTMTLVAQKKNFTVRDVEVNSRRELAPKSMSNLQWRGKSGNFTFQDSRNVFQQSVATTDTIRLINLSGLNQMLKSAGIDTLGGLPYITWANEQEFYFYGNSSWIEINIHSNAVVARIKFPEKSENQHLYLPSKKMAYTLDNNIFVTDANGHTLQLTQDLNPDIVNGQSVSRNEFGINEGIFWSPQGNYLAFYRKDNSKVGNYPLVDVTAREAKSENIKYPMAGMSSEHISLGIYNLAEGKTVFIEKQDTLSEKYLTNISWAPDEKSIYIQVLDRKQDHMLMNKYLVQDGSLSKTLFEEHHDKYFEPLNPIRFLNKNNGWFLYQSRRDGYNHVYLYDTEGKMIRQLTSGNWELLNILDVDIQDNVYYTSTEGSPLDENGFRINAENMSKMRLTDVAGSHRVILDPAFKYWIDDYSNTTTPHVVNLMSFKGKIIRNLISAVNPLTAYNMPVMTIGTLKAADGVSDLYYRLIQPAGLDSSKKYPAIIYVYGGPHTQLISNRWLGGARLWDYMMAQKGYIVLTVDNRGSDRRGLAFENVIHRQCGVEEMKDQLEGVKLLKSLGYVDMSRLGVHGWSYGGFMTTSLMTTYPGVFKVGVAGGPVIDWKYYEVMYGERYMDTPQENPDGFANTSLLNKAKNLQGKLLIIHGAQDPTVVWQNSIQFIQECIKNQIPVDYFIYPQAEHNVRGMERIHLMSKITSYFDDYL